MASLGNLDFNIKFLFDENELAEIKRKALEELKDIEIKLNVSGATSMDEVRAEIDKILSERKELNLGINKDALADEVKESISGEEARAELKAYEDLRAAIENVTGSREENIRTLVRLKNELSLVQEDIRILNKLSERSEGLSKKENERLKRRISREFELKEAIAERTKLIKADVRESRANEESMEKMAQTLTRLKTAYKKLDEEERRSPFGRQMQKEIKKLDTALKNMDADIGNFQRNVGNYASAFDEFRISSGSIDDMTASLNKMKAAYRSMSEEERKSPMGIRMRQDIKKADAELKKLENTMKSGAWSVSGFNKLQWETNQLLRELPALAYGPNIFFGAISNNLPMFFDGVKKAKDEYSEFVKLQEQGIDIGKRVQPVWKQLVKTLVSWQSIMIICITLLTKYGHQIFDATKKLFSFGDAAKLSRSELKELNKGFSKGVSESVAKLDVLFDALDKATYGTKEWNAARSAILKQHGDLLNTMDAEISSLHDKAAAYKILRDEIIATAKEEAVQKSMAGVIEKATEVAIKGYNKIYKEALEERGEDYARSLVNRIREQIESTGKLSAELSNEIESVFTKTQIIRIGGISYTKDEIISYNKVADVIKEITKAQDDVIKKREAVESAFAWFTPTEKEVKENKKYWENEKRILEERYANLTAEQVKGEEGRKLREEIAEIDKKLSVWETDSTSNDLLNRVSLLMKANKEYEEWLSLVGEEKALIRAREILPEFDPDTLREELKKISVTGDEKAREAAISELLGLDKETIERTLRKTEKTISDAVSKWRLFSELWETSGDYTFAMQAVWGGDIGFKSSLEQLQSMIERHIEENKLDISFDDLIKLDTEDVTRKFGAAIGALVAAYREEEQKLSEESLKRAAELLGEYKDAETKRNEIIKQAQEDRLALIRSGMDAEEAAILVDEKLRESLAKFDFEQFKKTDLWSMMFEDISRISTKRIEEAISKIKEFIDVSGSALDVTSLKEMMNVVKKATKELEKRNPFKALAEGINDLAKAGKNEDEIARAIDKISDAFKNAKPIIDIYIKSLDEVRSMFEALGKQDMVDVIDSAKEAVSSIAAIGEGFQKGKLIGGIGAAVGETFKWLTKGFKASAEHRKELESIMREAVAQQREYNLLLMRQNLEFERAITIFGSDAYSKASNAVTVLKDAIRELNNQLKGTPQRFKGANKALKESYAGLANIQIKTGHKKTGLFGLGSGKDIYSSILDVYPELIDANGKFNISLAETILATRTMDEDSKAALQNIVDYAKLAEEAIQEMKGYLSDIFGDLGQTMSDALVDAFRNGTDAAEAFTDSVTNMLERLAESMIYSVTIAPYLEQAQEEMLAVMQDEGLTDEQKFRRYASVLDDTMDNVIEGAEIHNDLFEAYKKAAAERGYELWAPEVEKGGGLTAGIKGITEDTASILASYVNSMRADLAMQLSIIQRYVESDVPEVTTISRAQLAQLQNIAKNTDKNAKIASDIYDLLNSITMGTKSIKVK